LNGVSGWEVVSAPTPATGGATVISGGWFTATVACPAGKRPLAGGFEAAGNGPQLTVIGSLPMSSATPGWMVELRNNTSLMLSNVQIRVFAICGFVL
jgi:hypothetical protein